MDPTTALPDSSPGPSDAAASVRSYGSPRLATIAADGADEARSARFVSVEEAQLLAWALLATVSAVLQGARPNLLVGGFKTNLLQALYPAGQHLAAGVLMAALRWALRTRGSRSAVWTLVALLGSAFTLGWAVLKEDFALAQNRLASHAPPLVWRSFFTLLVALAVPLALVAGKALTHPRVRARLPGARLVAVLAALGAHLFVRGMVLPASKPGFHLLMTIAFATMMGAALEGAALPALRREGVAAQIEGEPRPSIARHVVWGLAAIWGVCAFAIAPPMQVAVQMMKPPAAALAPFALELHAAPIPPPRTPEDVAASLPSAPPAAPSGLSQLPADGAVILVTIDCLRADLLASDRFAEVLPNLTALQRSGASFSEARTAASYTMASISSIFAGRYESQLAWSERPLLYSRYRMPVRDPSPRFPELLDAAGVRTVFVRGVEWLDNGSGMVRGFSEEIPAFTPPHFGIAEEIVGAAIERMDDHAGGQLFLYLHLFDAHHPYNRGGEHGTQFERYLREMALVDRQVGQLVRAAEARFPGRAITILTADHGEAFGEHGSERHGLNVYDEAVRVPLIVTGPGIAPRRIHDPVSTIDLGPTILDLFRLPTPSTFMSRSLLPLVMGHDMPPEPVAIEANNYAALIEGGYKIIRRRPYDTIELYDLRTDPDEKINLFREDDPVSSARLVAMNKFFDDLARK